MENIPRSSKSKSRISSSSLQTKNVFILLLIVSLLLTYDYADRTVTISQDRVDNNNNSINTRGVVGETSNLETPDLDLHHQLKNNDIDSSSSSSSTNGTTTTATATAATELLVSPPPTRTTDYELQPLSSASADIRECEDMDVSLPMLAEALRSGPETNGLRPWSGRHATTGKVYSFQGLDEDLLTSVFRGRRVALFGDSTLAFPMKWLYTLFKHTTNSTLHRLSSLDLNDANRLINPSGDKDLRMVGPPIPVVHPQRGTHLRWYGEAGVTSTKMCYFADSVVWSQLAKAKPQIVVLNQGLHYLHLFGGGRDRPECTIHRWINYEQLLDEIIHMLEQIGVQIILFKTTNRIWDEKFTGLYRVTNNLYRANDKATLNKCSDLVQGRMPGESETDVANYCQNATLTGIGTSHLNTRLRAYVERLQQQQQQVRNSSLKVHFLFDEYNLMASKEYAIDGRHHHTLNLLRIRFLANTLQCLLGNTTLDNK